MSDFAAARAWLEGLGFSVSDEALWLEALTHGSTASGLDYQRLEFLGDRVLGLSIAEWLYRRDDGGLDSDNILCDVMEALLGASFLESGFEATREVVHALWADPMEGGTGRRKHPKSALQEWAAGNRRKHPEYEVTDRSGPDHAALFTVRVSVAGVGAVEAPASSKQDAETAAAKKFMETYG